MSERGSGSPAEAPAKRLRFDRHVLDLDRGCLLLDGAEIALRPKTFAVLRHLVENAGRLVSKDELFAAVWPNLAVTDDALVQSIGELRRALGDDGARLIKTIPRRGYRLDVTVSAAADTVQPALPAPAARSAGAPHAWRIGLSAAALVAVLLAAGVVWSGVRSDWRILGVLGSSGPARPDIGKRPAIAVLPFVNQSGDPARDYFADGLTQDIIYALGRFPELTVMSWNAVFPYRGKPASPADISRSLAVRYQVEGSVVQAGDRVRVTAQLVGADGQVLWSQRFDEALPDLFAMQNRITAEVAGAMAIRVSQIEQRRVLDRPTGNFEAYDYVLRARPALQRPARAKNIEARALLRQATALDPSYAAAHAALAATYYLDVSLGWAESPAANLRRAEELAIKALSLNDAEVVAHIVLGRVHMFYQRHEQALAEMERAIAVNPNDAAALAGRGNVLMWMGQTDAAIESLELAQRIDPELNALDRFALSLAYYVKHRYDAAVEQSQINIRKSEAAHFSRVVLAAAYAQQNRSEDAGRVVALIRRTDPTFDPRAFGNKFLNPTDLEHLRDGFRKAGLDTAEADGASTSK